MHDHTYSFSARISILDLGPVCTVAQSKCLGFSILGLFTESVSNSGLIYR